MSDEQEPKREKENPPPPAPEPRPDQVKCLNSEDSEMKLKNEK